MKRILALLLTILTIFTITSCKKYEQEIGNKSSSKNKSSKEYTVSFNTNGGSEINDTNIAKNTEIEIVPQTQKEGYSFAGWYLDSDLSTIALFPLKIESNITLYAKWLKLYTVNFNTNGGSRVNSATITENTKIENMPITQKSGYLFEGWYLDNSFTTAAVFPLKIENDTTLHAKWLKLDSSKKIANASIKLWQNSNDKVQVYVTPEGFEMDRLDALGYKMTITVSYDVRYKKDYDVLFDVGYAGAPKYEAYLLNSDNAGDWGENLTTTLQAKTKTLSYTSSIANIKNDKFILTFSTDNIQNTIYFENIVVTYKCHK